MSGNSDENDPESGASPLDRHERRAEMQSPRRSRSRSRRRARESSDDDSEVEERRRRREKEKRRRQREEEEEEERRRRRRRERERENRHRERGYDDGYHGDRRGGYDRHEEDRYGGGSRRPTSGDRYGGGGNGSGRIPRGMPSRDGDPSNAFIMKRLTERERARIRRDFGQADAIRDELLHLGVEIWESKGERAWKAADGRTGPRPNHEGKCL